MALFSWTLNFDCLEPGEMFCLDFAMRCPNGIVLLQCKGPNLSQIMENKTNGDRIVNDV